jgi:hypothetical protein
MTKSQFQRLAGAYRKEAIKRLAEAEELLTENCERSLLMSALFARMSIEGFCAQRLAVAYSASPSIEPIKDWQPKKVLKELLDISPALGGNGATLRISRPHPDGSLEIAERTLTTGDIKKRYDALSSLLHVSTPKKGMPDEVLRVLDLNSARSRVQDALSMLTEIRDTPVWGLVPSWMGQVECGRCGGMVPFKFAVAPKVYQRIICPNCEAPHIATLDSPDGNLEWFANSRKFECANEECSGSVTIWWDQLTEGTHWRCETCKLENVLDLRAALAERN